jgi:hypothetical protein
MPIAHHGICSNSETRADPKVSALVSVAARAPDANDDSVALLGKYATMPVTAGVTARSVVRDRAARLAHLARRSEAQPAPCAPSRLSK